MNFVNLERKEYMNKTNEEILNDNKFDVAVDFDGVIHKYTSGFSGVENILDTPVSGAIDVLKEYLQILKVAIFSTRASTPEGIEAIKVWLLKYGMTEKEIESLTITNIKIHANLYVDDRAWHFDGRFPSIKYIKGFKPWNKMFTFWAPRC